MYKKTSELTAVELAARREATRQRKAKHDLKQKMGAVIDYADFELPESQEIELNAYTKAVEQKIISELPTLAGLPGRLREPEREMVHYVASVVAGVERKIIREVSNPDGVLFGRFYGDAAARQVIEFTHRDNTLLASPAFRENYNKMLQGIAAYFRGIPSSEIRDVKAELAGTYKLPPLPDPVPVIGFVTERPVPRPLPSVAPVVTAADQVVDQ